MTEPTVRACVPAYLEWEAQHKEAKEQGTTVPSWCFDVLIDPHHGDRTQVNNARAQAAALCNACPVRDRCLSDNADEPWARLVLGVKPDNLGERRRTDNQRRHDMRHSMLVALIAADSPLERVLRWMNMTETQLYKWCHWHKHLDLWAALTPNHQPNQHRRAS